MQLCINSFKPKEKVNMLKMIQLFTMYSFLRDRNSTKKYSELDHDLSSIQPLSEYFTLESPYAFYIKYQHVSSQQNVSEYFPSDRRMTGMLHVVGQTTFAT